MGAGVIHWAVAPSLAQLPGQLGLSPSHTKGAQAGLVPASPLATTEQVPIFPVTSQRSQPHRP